MDITINNRKWSLLVTLQILSIIIVLFGMVILYNAVYQLRDICTQSVATVSENEIAPVAPVVSTTSTTSQMVTTQSNIVTEVTSYTFDQTGTLVFNAGATTNAWYLFYNTPKQLGKVIQLAFSNKSICLDAAQKVISCTLDTSFASGDQIRVIGYETGSSVTVGTLLKLAK